MLTPAEIERHLNTGEWATYQRLVEERAADPKLRQKGWSRRIKNLEHRALTRLQAQDRKSQPPLPLEPI